MAPRRLTKMGSEPFFCAGPANLIRNIRKRALTPFLPFLLLGLLLSFPAGGDESGYAAARQVLVDEVRTQGLLDPLPGQQRIDEKVLRVLNEVPRHEFVPEPLRHEAYYNRPLPIGHGQTISQPYIVAIMTDLVKPEPDDVVLEVGTGSGYQAAVLAKLVKQVYSVEIIEALAEEVKPRLERLGYDNVSTKLGDGYFGWEEQAPFDAIVVTAAAGHVPPPLIEQLRPGGRMVIPVGGRFSVQYLLLLEKTPAGEIITQQVMGVRFVPLTGEH
jgi:protein-L-isoaspartate(D-aspartate) O-methyltransferase